MKGWSVTVENEGNGMAASAPKEQAGNGQLLHLVFGGRLASLDGDEFENLEQLDIVGIFPNYAEAHQAWKEKAQMTVDNAQMRYVIVHLHRLLQPETNDAER